MITTPLPLFPLRLVLLPGAVVPLHIFEPRYRALIRDVTEGNSATHQFGLISPPQDTDEADLPAGRVGCVAQITSVDTMPDGRANILVEGGDRFRFETYVNTGTPYRMAHVSAFDDKPDDAAARIILAEKVRDLAARAIRATMTVHDVTSEPPELDVDDAALSFQLAHPLQLDDRTLYLLLCDRSPIARLITLRVALERRLTDIVDAAELHTRAKTNGHHHGPLPT